MVAPRQSERLFDLRTVRRHMRSGLVSKERYEEWLKTLPDVSDNVAPLSFEDDEHRKRRDPVISPTRVSSAPFDDDDDDDYDDEDDLDDDGDDDDDGEADGGSGGDEADKADKADEAPPAGDEG